MSGWTILTKYVYAFILMFRGKRKIYKIKICVFMQFFFQILEGRISEAMMIVIVKLVNMYMFAKKNNIYLPY